MGVGIRRGFRALLAGSLLLGSVAVGALAVGSLPASASGNPVLLYVSTSGSDGGGSNACTASTAPCLTIQQAINEAQNYPTADADDVIINVAAGTYTENDTVDASSLHSLTIAGAGASSTTVNGPVGSVFTVDSGVVTISGLTITGGHGEFGGAIENFTGTLNVTDSTLSGNNGYQGGAIENFTGTLNVTDSTISGNTGSGYGGGIFDDGGGTVTVTDSTMSGNNGSSGGGGAIFIQNGTVTVTDSTISGNTGGSYGGGGIYINSGIAYVGGTILADNTGGNCRSNLLTSVGYNLTNDEGRGMRFHTAHRRGECQPRPRSPDQQRRPDLDTATGGKRSGRRGYPDRHHTRWCAGLPSDRSAGRPECWRLHHRRGPAKHALRDAIRERP